MQIIKVWHGQGQAFHEEVYDIAGNSDNGASVDLGSCQVSGPGETQMCATWRDPNFDPEQPAAYYLRVVENPSCRWSWRDCLALPEAERPAACHDTSVPQTIQERAWTSPIWYDPADDMPQT